MGNDGGKFQAVHKPDCVFPRTFETEGNDAASTVRHVFLSQSVVFVVFQSRIIYPSDLRATFEEFGDFLRIFAVASHTQMKGFEAEVEQECVLRSLYRSEVAHELGRRFGDISHFAEGAGIGKTVIRFVGAGQPGEFIGMSFPVEISAVDDGSAYAGGVPVHIFGRRVCYDVGSPLERTAVDGCGECVVDDEGYSMPVGDAGKFLDVENVHAGVG